MVQFWGAAKPCAEPAGQNFTFSLPFLYRFYSFNGKVFRLSAVFRSMSNPSKWLDARAPHETAARGRAQSGSGFHCPIAFQGIPTLGRSPRRHIITHIFRPGPANPNGIKTQRAASYPG